jgi:LysR family glycine cleavage system transcriptional activator
MPRLRKTLPPVNSLVIFESAARHLNFTHAAEELGITQAAVSRQVQLLEDHLGRTLFNRLPRGLQLTTEGARFQRAVTRGLEHIADVAVEIRRTGGPDEITVSTSVTFASYWLMARLMKFRAAHPDVELRLVASRPVHDLAAAGIDLAVRYGSGQWPDVEAIRLFDNEIVPVCAPRYLAGRAPMREPAELLDERLLHLSKFDRNWVTWEAWFRAFGITERPRRRGIGFDNYLVLLQSALRGDGIALCGRRLAEDFITRGDLIRPVGAALRSEQAFYLLHPKHVALSRNAELFRDWLLAEAKSPASDG